MSGPCSCPVSALRSVMNRPRPLRPVSAFTAFAHWLQLSPVSSPSGSRVVAVATKSLSSSSTSGVTSPNTTSTQCFTSGSNEQFSRTTVQKGSSAARGSTSASRSFTASKGRPCRMAAFSDNNSASSKRAGARPILPKSNSATSWSSVSRASTLSDVPIFASRLETAIGS